MCMYQATRAANTSNRNTVRTMTTMEVEGLLVVGEFGGLGEDEVAEESDAEMGVGVGM